MIMAFIYFLSAQSAQNITDRLIAALVFAGFLTLTVVGFRKSGDFTEPSNEWTTEEFERILSESPELRAAIDSVEARSDEPK